jgi:hypothetical protein
LEKVSTKKVQDPHLWASVSKFGGKWARQGLPGLKQWKGWKSIGLVLSECIRDGKEAVEMRDFLSSLDGDMKRFHRMDINRAETSG